MLASPSPNASCLPGVVLPIIQSPCHSPTSSPTPSLSSCNKIRRPSSALLHPDHARLLALRSQQISPDQSSIEDLTEFAGTTSNGCIASGNSTVPVHRQLGTASSSTTSSLTSVAGASIQQQRYILLEI